MNGKTNHRKNELYGDLIRKPNEDSRWVLYCIPVGLAILISLFLNGKNCNNYDQQALSRWKVLIILSSQRRTASWSNANTLLRIGIDRCKTQFRKVLQRIDTRFCDTRVIINYFIRVETLTVITTPCSTLTSLTWYLQFGSPLNSTLTIRLG